MAFSGRKLCNARHSNMAFVRHSVHPFHLVGEKAGMPTTSDGSDRGLSALAPQGGSVVSKQLLLERNGELRKYA